MNHTLTGIQEAYNAMQKGASLAANVADVIDNKLRENAQIEARNAQLQYEQDAANFLTELENSNNFDQWQNKANDFLQKYSNNLQAKAKNAYTAKLLDQQMKQNATQMNVNLINAVNKGMNKESKVQYEKNLELIAQNYKGQDRVDLSIKNLDEQYAKGLIDLAGYETEARNITINASVDDYMSQSNDLVSNAIQYGMNEAWINEKLESMADNILEYTTKSGKQKITSDERKKIKSSVIKQAQNEYKVKVKELQEANEQKLTNIIVQMDRYPEGDPRSESLKAQGRAMLSNMMNQNALSLDNGAQKSYAAAFKPHKPKDDTSGSGSKKVGSIISTCETEIKRELDRAKLGLNSGKKGYETAHGVVDRVNEICDKIIGNTDISDDDRNEIYSSVYVTGIEYATSQWPKTDKVSKAVANCEQYLKDIKHPELKSEMLSMIVDMTMDMDISKLNEADIVNKVTTILGTTATKELTAMQLDKLGNAKLKEKNVAKAFGEIGKYKLMYTNAMDQTVYKKGVEENLKVIDNHFTDYLEAYGIDPENLTASWESDGKHGETGNRIYTDSTTGYKYRFMPTADGKSFTMQVAADRGYGKVFTEKDMQNKKNSIPKEVRAQNDAKRKEIKQQENAINDAQKQNRVEKWNNERVIQAATYSYDDMPDAIKSSLPSKAEWNKKTAKEKQDYLRNNKDAYEYVTKSWLM